jgi:nucleotide-binding universal stress UspA family protein
MFRGGFMYEHILVSSDGSTLAQLGVDHGLALAKLHGSKVTAVTVTEPLGGQFAFAGDLWTPSEAEIASYDAAQRKIAERILVPIKAKAEEMGLAIETIHVPWRLVAGALLQVADEVGCDLIVMSSHGRTGMDRVMMGSQTAEVMNRAKVPVVVVR